MVELNPQMREMLQNPELLRQLTSPEMMQVDCLSEFKVRSLPVQIDISTPRQRASCVHVRCVFYSK